MANENGYFKNGVWIATEPIHEVEGTAALLRYLGDKRFRLMGCNGDEAFFHKDEFLGGFIHSMPDILDHFSDKPRPRMFIAVVRFFFGCPKSACEHCADAGQECGEHRMVLFQHVDQKVCQNVLNAVVMGIWGGKQNGNKRNK